MTARRVNGVKVGSFRRAGVNSELMRAVRGERRVNSAISHLMAKVRKRERALLPALKDKSDLQSDVSLSFTELIKSLVLKGKFFTKRIKPLNELKKHFNGCSSEMFVL